jgi:hypothetical protein
MDTLNMQIAAPGKGPGGAYAWTEANMERLESEIKRQGRGSEVAAP